METVTIKALFHRNRECIGIFFDNDAILNVLVRSIPKLKWSRTNRCWYIGLSKENYEQLAAVLKDRVKIDRTHLSDYMHRKRSGVIEVPATREVRVLNHLPEEVPLPAVSRIQPVNAHVLPAMKQRLKLKAYSTSTIRTYLNEMAQLLFKLGKIPADDLMPEHLRRYLVYCFEELKLTENTLHSRINALKFYFEQVLGREKFFWEIPRPKKQLQLPHFFNQDEISSIIKSVGNTKHKTMLMLAYASGLRVSEVVNIKVRDIDSKRMCILIKQAKGKKDRIVSLSPVLLIMMREYWRGAGLSKDGYLFPGQKKGECMSSRALQGVLAVAKKKAGILKPGSIHALRHSFATHLLDKGTDVTMIKKLLGHNDIRTTLRYLHVTNRDMLQIISPLDDLDLG